MKKFAALLRVSFRGMLLTANPTRKNRKKAATGAGFLVLMCCLMLYLGGVYSFVFASLLAPLGRLDLMLSLMALIGVSMSFFLGVASGAGFVFGGRDNDILLAMPVASNTAAMAECYGGDYVFASACVSVSTLLSVVTVPVITWLIQLL